VLGLDERNLLDLYESVAPAQSPPPTPFVELGKGSKRRLVLVTLLLVSIFPIIYLGKGYLSPKSSSTQIKKDAFVGTQNGANETALRDALEIKEPESLEEQKAIATGPDRDVEEVEREEASKSERLPILAEEETAIAAVEETLSAESTTEPLAEDEWLVLDGIVNARTWVKIYVDDEEPKEFIFQTGSRPQWKARKGFYVLVGNAGGIEFDFNGKKIENLGRLGEVVQLRLPGASDLVISED
jgi:cytoskeletal protein RodZ